MVIPAFAVGRTQTVMYYLRNWRRRRRFRDLPMYVDSPMAISVTELYMQHHEDHDMDFTRAGE